MNTLMKKYALFAILTLLLTACASSSRCRYLIIDMRDYVGLSNKEKYRMVFDNPRLKETPDTIYWSGDKSFKWEIPNDSSEFLAFVEVSTLDEEGYVSKRLFRSVAAIDTDEVTIRATQRDSVFLSGSESNQNICRFWYMKADLDHAEITDTASFMWDYTQHFLQSEMQQHPNDLYGAYLYSIELFLHLATGYSGGDSYTMLPALRAAMQHANTYYAEHNVFLPLLERIMEVGDVSAVIVYEYTSYLYQ